MASKEKPVRVTIPATIEEAVAALEGLGALLTAKSWERAAIVYAFTVLAEAPSLHVTAASSSSKITPEQFAALGIHGLRSKDTVRLYHERWAEYGKAGIKPGQTVTLPDVEWPPTGHDSSGVRTEAGMAHRLQQMVETHGPEAVASALPSAVRSAAARPERDDPPPLPPIHDPREEMVFGMAAGEALASARLVLRRLLSDLGNTRFKLSHGAVLQVVEGADRLIELANLVKEAAVHGGLTITDSDIEDLLREAS